MPWLEKGVDGLAIECTSTLRYLGVPKIHVYSGPRVTYTYTHTHT